MTCTDPTQRYTPPRRDFACAAALWVLSLLGEAGPALAGDVAANDETLAEAVSGGNASVSARYRFEHVSNDSFDDNANASTVRLRLNYTTKSFRDWQAVLEFDHVAEVLADDFNPGDGITPNRARYPTVADPDGSDLNQLYLDYTGVENALFRVGRQRLLLDNERFIGGVGWRQNEQTFDAASFRYSGWKGTELQYSYVARVNRIFGEKSPAGRHDTNIHVLHSLTSLPDDWVLTGYFYYIDNEEVAAFSTATLGMRMTGEVGLVGQRFRISADLASQTDAASAPVSFHANYGRFDGTWFASKNLSLTIFYEVLGGNRLEPGKSFRTPLATLHKFQGWSDQFLTTPAAGVQDLALTLAWQRAKWQLQTDWHKFTAESGNADLGREFNISLTHEFGRHYRLMFKAAFFDARNAAYRDINKFWLMLVANYP